MVLEAMEKNNLDQNTMVIFVSEQGMSFPWGKRSCYEDGLRVAGFVWWPGKVEPRRTSAIIEYVDIVPTLIELAGGKPAAAMEGKSFLEVLSGQWETHKTAAYGVQTMLCSRGHPYPIRTVRDERYRLIVNYLHEDGFSNLGAYGVVKEWEQHAEKDPKAKALLECLTKRSRVELYGSPQRPL